MKLDTAPPPKGSPPDSAAAERSEKEPALTHEELAHAHHVTRHRLRRRWHASLAMLVAMSLYVLLPQRLTFVPAQAVIGIELVLLVPITIVTFLRGAEGAKWQRIVTIGMVAILNAANFISLVLLVNDLLHGGYSSNDPQAGVKLMLNSGSIWLTNIIVFGLWYWELDRGGPIRRAHIHEHELKYGEKRDLVVKQPPDFLFPYMASPHFAPADWSPSFTDYLYVSFTNSTAFSPTDTLPLTHWAKLLMMVQSLISLVTVALVAARAVNILK